MELRALLHEQHIHVATIQESKLTTTSTTPSFPGYTTLRHDRPTRGGGGLLTLIHKDIPFTNTTAETHVRMPHDPTLELQSTHIQIHKHHYNIDNIYIPPTDYTPRGYTPSLNYLNTITNSFILGDFNAHDPVWLTTQNTDTRATTLQEQLDSYIILNNPHTPTRKPFNINTSPTSPNISFASPNLALRSSWHTLHDLSSDHIPILITYRLHAPVEHKQLHTFTNYNRAQWDTFTASVDNHLQSFAINNYTSIDAVTKHVTDTIINVSKRTIPTGNIRHYNPTLTRTIKHKIQTRKHLRSLAPTQDTLTRIQQLNTDIDAEIKTQQKLKWQKTGCASSPGQGPPVKVEMRAPPFPPFLHAQDWESCLGPL